MRPFWPAAEAAQADYEKLRAAALAGTPLADAAAGRFTRGGLVALIARPVAEPEFTVIVRGATRAPWTPHADPRVQTLAACYWLLLATADTNNQDQDQDQEVAR